MSDWLRLLLFSAVGLATAAAGALGAWLIWRRLAHRWAMQVLRDFAVYFPGRCPICSYHAYGWHHGHESSPRPPPHECIEARR